LRVLASLLCDCTSAFNDTSANIAENNILSNFVYGQLRQYQLSQW